MLTIVLKKIKIPHMCLQQTNKHNVFKLFFIEQPPASCCLEQLQCICYSMMTKEIMAMCTS